MIRFRPAALMLAATLALPLGTTAMADEVLCKHDHSHKRHHDPASKSKMIKALLASWELSDKQLARLDSARTEMKTQARALHDKTFEDRQAKQAAWHSLRNEYRQALAEALSDEQLAVLDLMMQRQQHKTPKG